MMIDPLVVDEVKHRSDIVEVISRYVPLKKAGNTYKACCPFHQEKTPSFNVNPEKQFYYCFGCQKGGDVIGFVREHEGVDFEGAVRLLADYAGMTIAERTPGGPGGESEGPSGPRKEDLYEVHDKVAAWFQKNLRAPEGREGLEYLTGRGLTEEWLQRFGVGYAPKSFDAALTWGKRQGFSPELLFAAGILTSQEQENSQARKYDRWRDRVMFPIWNEQGRIVAFSGRVLPSNTDKNTGKYVNSPETAIFHKSAVLYALPLAREGIKAAGCALLCEGQMDTIAYHRAGITNAVAPQGTAFTETQARLLKRYTDKLLLSFDADPAGVKAMLKAHEAFLPAGLSARVVQLEGGKDPDALLAQSGADALRQQVARSTDYFDFFLAQQCLQADPADRAGKAQIIQAYLDVVQKLESKVQRAECCELLANRLGLMSNYVFEELTRMSFARKRRELAAQVRAGTPIAGAPVPVTVVPESALRQTDQRQVQAEATLLDIALHHQGCAQQLLAELKHEDLSDSPVGQALNEVLAHTANGEWELAAKLVAALAAQQESALLLRLMVTPEFGPATDPRRRNKAYAECLMTHRRVRLEAQIKALKEEMNQAPSRLHKTELLKRQVVLQGQLNRMLSPPVEARPGAKPATTATSDTPPVAANGAGTGDGAMPAAGSM